jgi:hypothetical protein
VAGEIEGRGEGAQVFGKGSVRTDIGFPCVVGEIVASVPPSMHGREQGRGGASRANARMGTGLLRGATRLVARRARAGATR